MSNFLEKITPVLFLEDSIISEAMGSHLREYPLITAELTNQALRFAVENKEAQRRVLLDFSNGKVNDESVPLLLQVLEELPLERKHLAIRFVKNLPIELLVKYESQLRFYVGNDYMDLCLTLHSYTGKSEEELEDVWDIFYAILKNLAPEHNATLYNKAKRVQDFLIASGSYDALEVENILREEQENEFFYENGFLAVRAVGLLQLHHLVPTLVSLFDRLEEDFLIEELIRALIRLQTDEVVKELAPLLKDDRKTMMIVSILKQIKTPLSEQVLVEAYSTATIADKEAILDALTSQFSEKAFPLVEDFIERNQYALVFDMDEMFYAFYKVMGRKHPQLEQWRADIIERQKRFEEDLPKLDMKKIIQDKFGKIGRNNPCICGSGKKFKKCCGK